MQESVEVYLRGKGLEVFRASGGRQLTLKCIFCGENHSKGKMYVNAENGAFDCKICGVSGGWRMLLEHFGDEPDEESPAYKPSRALSILTEYAELSARALRANPRIVEYLTERGLTADTIASALIGFHAKNYSIVDSMEHVGVKGGYTRAEVRETGLLDIHGREFHEGRITIPYLLSRQVHQVRGKDPKAKYFTIAGDEVQLYNADALRGAETVLITEGEFDCLIVQQTLSAAPETRARNIAVVAVPGTQSLPGGNSGFPKFFEDARRVYVGFDTDDAGRRGALKVRELLGAKARLLELPEQEMDWTDWLAPKTTTDRLIGDIPVRARPNGGHGWADIMRLIHEADMRDKRVYSVAEAAAQLYELEHSAPGIKLGYPSLDALIKPGLRPGSLTIPLARTGVGKSVLLANFIYNTRAIPQLLITLEMTAPETWNRLRRIARFYHPAMDEHELQTLFDNVRIVDENAVSAESFDSLIEEFKEEVGASPQLCHVDYLGYYARAQRGVSQYEKVSSAVMSLKERAKAHRMALISPGQVNRTAKPGEPISEDDARDAGAIEETADFLFGIWRPWEATSADLNPGQQGHVQSDLMLRLLKSRHGNKGRTVRLAMSHASLAIVDQTAGKNVHRVDIENGAINRGESYESIYDRSRQQELAKLQGELPPWENEKERA